MTLAKLDAYYILVAAKMAAIRGVVKYDFFQELAGKLAAACWGLKSFGRT